MAEIHERFGEFHMVENDCRFDEADKPRLEKLLFVDKKIPKFSLEVDKVSYRDGLKVYFKNGGWIIARFSGTEPLLRVFAEMSTQKQAHAVGEEMKEFLGI